MNSPLVKVYGERNTGTNYLTYLIRTNLNVRLLPGVPPKPMNALLRRFPKLPIHEPMQDFYFRRTFERNLGWKHSLVLPARELEKLPICDDISFITISKNPYSWLLSLYNRPYHYYERWEDKEDFETFLTSPAPVIARENARDLFTSPVDVWNQKNRAYVQLTTEFPTLNLRYEDLIEDPEAAIESIGRQLACGRKTSKFKNRERSTMEKGKSFSFYQERYLEERWKYELSRDQILLINERLDAEVMDRFEYQVLA